MKIQRKISSLFMQNQEDNSDSFLETVLVTAVTTRASGAFAMNTGTDIYFKRSFAASRWVVK